MLAYPVHPPATFGISTSSSTTLTLPVIIRTWTWAEAIAIASRVTESRATVRRTDGHWVVSYRARPVARN